MTTNSKVLRDLAALHAQTEHLERINKKLTIRLEYYADSNVVLCRKGNRTVEVDRRKGGGTVEVSCWEDGR